MECLDASVVVKWFKSDEADRNDALELFHKAVKTNGKYVASEWLILEVVRALVKNGISAQDIEEDYRIIKRLLERGAIKTLPVTEVLELAKDIQIRLHLYAADAVHLATAISTGSSVRWTEDDHLRKKSVKEYAAGYGLAVKRLEE